MAVVPCPTCNRDVEWTSASRFRPFCSERCKNVDLGAWASEKYAIAAEPANDNESEEPPR